MSAIQTTGSSLREKLISDGLLRWLDVGCGGNFEDGFDYIDLFPPEAIDSRFRDRYHRIDLIHAEDGELRALGKYDFVRMQHTFEHFSYEEGQIALKRCAALLRPGGLILITTPDLRVHIKRYLTHGYRSWTGFQWWANKRIPKDAPDSCYFSIFAHSMPFEAHQWCYDYEGLVYQLSRSGLYGDICELKVGDPLWQQPFTHNRPEEDVCVMARRVKS